MHSGLNCFHSSANNHKLTWKDWVSQYFSLSHTLISLRLKYVRMHAYACMYVFVGLRKERTDGQRGERECIYIYIYIYIYICVCVCVCVCIYVILSLTKATQLYCQEANTMGFFFIVLPSVSWKPCWQSLESIWQTASPARNKRYNN